MSSVDHPRPEFDSERRRIHEETVSAADGPVGLFLGSQRLRIVSPERDLGEPWNVDYLIIDEAVFEESDRKTGYKGIGDGETIVLGRSSKYDRFHFLSSVSRRHVEIARQGDEFTITDLGSLNGTFIESKDDSARRKTGPLDDESATEAATVEAPEATPEKELTFQVAGESVASEFHPDRNEDAYFVDESANAIGVFDGLGGHHGSDRASRVGAQAVQEYLGELPEQLARSLANESIREALEQAHQRIVEESEGSGIATTATVGKIFSTESGSRFLVIGSVGDSRAYLFRDGEFNHVTLDQAYVYNRSTEERKRLQETLAGATDLSSLDEDERVAFLNRNVINGCLGIEANPPVVTLSDLEVHPGDRVLITSDGIHDNLTDAEVERVLRDNDDPDTAVRKLVAAARERSRDDSHIRAKPDDMTAAVMDCDAAE